MAVMTKRELVKLFPTNSRLHKITKKQIKEILDAGEYFFVINWGYYRGFWRGATDVNYEYLFWHDKTSYDIDGKNYMTKEKTIDYIYQNRAKIKDIRADGGLWDLSSARGREEIE